MDQLIRASIFHTPHYWYEVGVLKVPAIERSRQDLGFILVLLVICNNFRKKNVGKKEPTFICLSTSNHNLKRL